MNRRARRTMIMTVALVAGIVAVLVVANWGTVRDHVEAWRFQLTRKTGVMTGPGRCGNMSEAEDLFWDLFWFSGRPVIFEYEDENQVRSMGNQRMRYVFDQSARADLNRAAEEGDIVRAVDAVKGVLALNGFRVLEQRFPRRAYVVIRDADSPPAQWGPYPSHAERR